MSDAQAAQWRAAASQASGNNEAAFRVVNSYLEQNENARRLWDLEAAAENSKAKTSARNAMTPEEMKTYRQMRALYDDYGTLWSMGYRAKEDASGLLKQVAGSFITLGEGAVQSVKDQMERSVSTEGRALQQAQEKLNNLVMSYRAYTYDENGVAHPTQEYLDAKAEVDAAEAALNEKVPETVLTPETSTGVRLYGEGSEHLSNAQLGLSGEAKFAMNTANAIAGNAPTMATALIPGVGPGISLGLSGAQAAGGRAAELSAQGESAGAALSRGLVSGGIEAATEILPVGSWVEIINNPGGKSALRSVLQQMGSEATEESASYVANYLADKAAQDPTAQFSLEELAENALMGGLTGGVYGGVGVGINRLRGGSANTQTQEQGATADVNAAEPAEIPELRSDEQPMPFLPDSSPYYQEWLQNQTLIRQAESSVDLGIPGANERLAELKGRNEEIMASQNVLDRLAETRQELGLDNTVTTPGGSDTGAQPAGDGIHTPEQLRTIQEYQASTDPDLVQYYRDVKSGEKKAPYRVGTVNERAAQAMRDLTGIDTTGNAVVLDSNGVQHINNRHGGGSGSADATMSNELDVGRINYVLENFDDAYLSKDKSIGYRLKSGKRAPTVVFTKKIDGHYAVVEATTDGKAKRNYIVSAFITNNLEGQEFQKNIASRWQSPHNVADDSAAFGFTSETPAALSDAMGGIPALQNEENIASRWQAPHNATEQAATLGITSETPAAIGDAMSGSSATQSVAQAMNGVNELPALDDGEGMLNTTEAVEGYNGAPPVSIGAMRNPFDREVVPSQTNMIDTIDTLNLRPEDIEAQGGLQQFTHERVSHAEQQYNADRIFETESMPEVEVRISEKPDWNDEDMVLAGRIQQEYDRRIASLDRNSQEYRDLLAQKEHFVGKMAQHTTSAARALEVTKMFTTPQQVQIQARQVANKAIDTVENDKRKGPQFRRDTKDTLQAVDNAVAEVGNLVDVQVEEQIANLLRDGLVDPTSRLYRRIQRYTEGTSSRTLTVEQVAANELVNQLFETAKESPLKRAETPGNTQRKATPIEQLNLALNNQDTYREVWNRTKTALLLQYADNPSMLNRLQDFFKNEAEGHLYSNKTLVRAISQILEQNNTTIQQLARQSAFGNTQAVDGFINEVVAQVQPPAEYESAFRDTLRQTVMEDSRFQNTLWNERTGSADQAVLRDAARQIGVNFRDLVKQSNRSKFEIGRQLSGIITEELGITGELADTVSNNIMDAYYIALSDAAEKNLNQLFRRQSNSQRTAQDQFLNLLRMGVYDDQTVKNYVATKYGIEPLTPEQSQQILELAEQAERLPENSRDRVNLENQIAGIAASQIKSSFKDKWDAWRYVAMLFNLRTNERNMAGNVAQGLNARAKDTVLGILEGTVDGVLKATGHGGIQRTTSVMTPLSARTRQLLGAAFTDADTNVYRQLTSSSEMFNLTRDARKNRRTFDNPVLNAVSNASDAALSGADYAGTAGFFDALGALDNKTAKGISNWIKNGVESLGTKGFVGVSGLRNNYAHSLASFLNANGADASIFQAADQASVDLLNSAREWAIQQALVNTYHQESKIGDKISQLKTGLKDSGPAGQAGYMVAEGLLPFVKTPINVAKNAVNYSPIGIMRSLVELGDTAAKTARGKATADYAVNRGLDHLAQGLTGSGIVLLGYMLAKNGLLVGGMDEEEEQEALLTGDQEYSIRLPDKDGNFTSYTVDWLSAWAMPAFVGAEIANLEDDGTEDDNLVNTIASSATSVLEPLLSMSFMQGVSDVVTSASYANNNGGNPVYSIGFDLATNYLTQGIPSLSGQIARTIDPYRRDSSSNGQTGLSGDLNYFLSSTANRIPFLSEQNEPHIDIWGNPEQNDGGDYLGRAVNNMLSPGYVGRSRNTAVDNYLEDLYDATGNAAVLPSEAKYTVSVKMDDVTRRLNAQERTEYQTARGQTSYNILEELVDNSTFQGLSDEDQASIVSDVYSLADKVGAAAAIPDYTSDDSLYGIYLDGGIDGVVNYALADASLSNARADKQNSTGDENAKLSSAETWDSMQSLGLDDEALVDTYLAKASDSTAERVNDLVGASGVVAYRDAYANADRDGNGDVTDNELRIALINSGLDDDLVFQTYMATQTTTNDAGETSTDDKAYSAYQTFGTSGGVNWMKYYSAYLVAKAQEQAAAKEAGESADLKGLAESLLNQMDLSEDERRAFFSMTDGRWTGNPY